LATVVELATIILPFFHRHTRQGDWKKSNFQNFRI